ncbi:hypothetical protein DSO57_1002006 [Entomophthora muscae]|uniref:Uncharacterized protein n=1 Tax=Entomophthora muscae TaxID=34485 RepID=A0ACC2RNY1_9FUNG|nr:hypothetical protein DSO57_1002006 [Entomophthora muscae]
MFGVMYITLTGLIDSMVPTSGPWAILGKLLSYIVKLAPILWWALPAGPVGRLPTSPQEPPPQVGSLTGTHLMLFAPVLERLDSVMVKVAVYSLATPWSALYMPVFIDTSSNLPLQIIYIRTILLDNSVINHSLAGGPLEEKFWAEFNYENLETRDIDVNPVSSGTKFELETLVGCISLFESNINSLTNSSALCKEEKLVNSSQSEAEKGSDDVANCCLPLEGSVVNSFNLETVKC